MISKELLCENLRLLEKSILWLLKSYDKAKVIQHIDEENIEIFETLLLVDISKKVIKYTSKYCKGEIDEKG